MATRGAGPSEVTASRAVAYDVVFGANARVYLDASFTRVNPPEVPTLATLLADGDLRVLGIDMNHGFNASAVLDRSGNPKLHDRTYEAPSVRAGRFTDPGVLFAVALPRARDTVPGVLPSATVLLPADSCRRTW